MEIKPIGTIHTPFSDSAGTPIQPRMAYGAGGTVEVFDEYIPGLKDIESFERIWLLFWCHRAATPKLHVKPYMDTREHGLFTTRAPARPNPIGISSVCLLEVKENILKVADVDMLDGSPLLDIKPYAPWFDCFEVQRCGWLDTVDNHSGLADNRFEQSHNVQEDKK